MTAPKDPADATKSAALKWSRGPIPRTDIHVQLAAFTRPGSATETGTPQSDSFQPLYLLKYLHSKTGWFSCKQPRLQYFNDASSIQYQGIGRDLTKMNQAPGLYKALLMGSSGSIVPGLPPSTTWEKKMTQESR
jgi:hypothetical protein